MRMFNLNAFINEYVIRRDTSLFEKDLLDNHDELLSAISDKSVLVIGGAGTIGASFVKSILSYYPKSLCVVDTNENALTELTRDLRSTDGLYVPEKYFSYPMDYSSNVFKKMFVSNGGFDIVANFSAHKHVRSEKDIYSIEAMLRNNVINARKLLDLLSEYPPQKFFCVSTDKAANPVNIMGASKRIMEDLIFSYSDRFPVKTARFANVAFSNGSLPDGFIDRINKLQPLSAPIDVKRYFVSPQESGQICMLASILGKNREILFPKLESSDQTSFDYIARELLKEYGYEIEECHSEEEAKENTILLKNGSKKYPVYFSLSDTSGEKPYEEFYTKDEMVDLQRFNALGVIMEKGIVSKNKINGLVDDLEALFNSNDTKKEDIVCLIQNYLPQFKHIETKKTLDSKM